MNNNTKLFGVLVAALLAFGAIGTSAQNGFSTFVELGDWEYNIGDSNTAVYCDLDTTCHIYTTDANNDYSKGDLYLSTSSDATRDVTKGDLRLFNTHGFDAGTLVQEDDADEGASLTLAKDGSTEARISYISSVNETSVSSEPDKLQNAELTAFFVNGTGTAVAEDDLSFTDGERIDSDHDLVGATLTQAPWTIRFANLDGDSNIHDEDEPLFADIDNSGDITAGDLVLNGDDFFTLVAQDGVFLANPTLIGINNSAVAPANRSATLGDNYYLAILDEQNDYNDNGYRGEDILLVRNVTSADGTFTEPRVAEYSYVLTGDRQGELITDGHPYHEEEFASITKGQMPIGTFDPSDADDQVVICAKVNDEQDDPVTYMAPVFFHFGDTSCDGNGADSGDVDVTNNNFLLDDQDGELASFMSSAFGDIFNQSAWFVLDLNDDGDVDEGEPVVLAHAGASVGDKLSALDVVFTEDGAILAGPGYANLPPTLVPMKIDTAGPTTDTAVVQFCTYYEEEEDENGNEVWVAHAVHLRSHYWGNTTTGEGPCSGTSNVEENVIGGDFVLAGDMNVGQFLTEDQADDYEGEYSVDNVQQNNYTVAYDDKFPSGFGPEDVVFLLAAGKPKLDEESFYVGGPAVSEGDDYYFVDDSDLVFFSTGPANYHFGLIEGDNRAGLSESDWLYLSFTAGTIDDETLILYKEGGVAGPGEEPETPEEPEEPEVPETPETPETPEEPEEPKKQPGFEAIALIAALGAALVLVRRRN